MKEIDCPDKNCIYRHTEYRSTGYGMPVKEEVICILEKEHKPCKEEIDFEDAMYDGLKEKNLGS